VARHRVNFELTLTFVVDIGFVIIKYFVTNIGYGLYFYTKLENF
jgi:hypothetical protein